MPRYTDVTNEEMLPVLSEIANEIVTAIRDVLEQTPPELVSDIYNDGIILTGGLSKLQGFAKLVSQKTKLRVRVHKYASDCVIMGCGKAIGMIDAANKELSQGISPLLTAY